MNYLARSDEILGTNGGRWFHLQVQMKGGRFLGSTFYSRDVTQCGIAVCCRQRQSSSAGDPGRAGDGVGDGINKAESLSQLLDIPAHLPARTHRNGRYSGAGDICCPEGRYMQEFR